MIGSKVFLPSLALFIAMSRFCLVSAEPVPVDVARRKLAELREQVKTASGSVDEGVSVTLLAADWPEDVMPAVRAMLSTLLEQPTVRLQASAVGIHASRNGEDAALLVPYLATSLPRADRGDAVHLLCAVRSIGFPAHPLEEIVRSKCDDSNAVVAIHAASALIRIAPSRRYPRGVLSMYLASEQPGHRWRAADAIARTRASEERWLERLAELLKDDDVRVRVTSAFALWRIADDPKVPFPVLVESLSQKDTSLATAFEYPSWPGDSHRAYALCAIMDMGDAGKPALPHVVSLVKELGTDETAHSMHHAVLGIVALNAARELGPVSETDFKEIEASVECEECAFSMVRDQARKILSTIGRQRKRGGGHGQQDHQL